MLWCSWFLVSYMLISFPLSHLAEINELENHVPTRRPLLSSGKHGQTCCARTASTVICLLFCWCVYCILILFYGEARWLLQQQIVSLLPGARASKYRSSFLQLEQQGCDTWPLKGSLQFKEVLALGEIITRTWSSNSVMDQSIKNHCIETWSYRRKVNETYDFPSLLKTVIHWPLWNRDNKSDLPGCKL